MYHPVISQDFPLEPAQLTREPNQSAQVTTGMQPASVVAGAQGPSRLAPQRRTQLLTASQPWPPVKSDPYALPEPRSEEKSHREV